MEEEMDYEDILLDFSSAAKPLMIPLEEPESQTPHVRVDKFPRSCTVAKPLLIQVAQQHPLPDEVETWTSFSTVAEPLMAEKETPPDEVNTSPCSSTKGADILMVQEAHAEEKILPSFSTVAEPLMAEKETPPDEVNKSPCSSTKGVHILMVQEAHAEEEILPSFSTVAEPLMAEKETPPDKVNKSPCSSTKGVHILMVQEAHAEEEILPSFSTVAEPLMAQIAAEVEQECPPERRVRRRTKKERQKCSLTNVIKLPGATLPAKPKHAWMDVSPAQDTKAEKKTIKKEREVEEKTPVMDDEMRCIEIEVDLRQERRMKKERKTEYATPPPAKAKLAWMEMDGDSAKVKISQKSRRMKDFFSFITWQRKRSLQR
ncbi:hypothetical protein PO909_013288 [Leuciscus waleckii]